MRFKKVTYLACLIVSLAGLLLVLAVLKVTEVDQEIYRHLVEMTSDKEDFEGETGHVARQRRGTSSKTLLLREKGFRKMGQLTSEASELSYKREVDGRRGLIEKMEGVTFLYQEELLVDTPEGEQIVIVLEAPRATYSYRQEKFEVDDVSIRRYLLPGLKLPTLSSMPREKTPFFKGSASFALVALGKGAPEIHFHDFRLFADDNEIYSPLAFLDTERGRGVFEGTSANKVHYKRGDSFSLKSLRLDLKFFEGAVEKGSQIEEVLAEDEVEIEMPDALHAAGDLAIFYGFDARGSFSKAHLEASYEGVPCQLKSEAGDLIQAASIDFDLPSRSAYLEVTRGVVNRGGESIAFTADAMQVDEALNQMILSPPVSLEGSFRLESQGAMIVRRDDERTLESISSEGPATFLMKDEKQGGEHLLRSFGAIFIDHREEKMRIDSPRNIEGKVEEGRQVHFEDLLGEIDADRATLFYAHVEGKFLPRRLLLEGEIKLQNRSPLAKQYALADEAEFDFASNILTLRAGKRPRVLLYDELNKVQASAPALEIKWDPATEKEAFRGIGQVRFVFAEDEFNELRRRFSFDDKK